MGGCYASSLSPGFLAVGVAPSGVDTLSSEGRISRSGRECRSVSVG